MAQTVCPILNVKVARFEVLSAFDEDSSFLGCCAVSTGKWLLTFRRMCAFTSQRREILSQRHCVTSQESWVFNANIQHRIHKSLSLAWASWF